MEDVFANAVRHAGAAIDQLRPLLEEDPQRHTQRLPLPRVVCLSIGADGAPSPAVLCSPEDFATPKSATFDTVLALSATCDRRAGVPVLLYITAGNHVGVYVHKFPWSDVPVFCKNCGSCAHENEACAAKRGAVELHVPR